MCVIEGDREIRAIRNVAYGSSFAIFAENALRKDALVDEDMQ